MANTATNTESIRVLIAHKSNADTSTIISEVEHANTSVLIRRTATKDQYVELLESFAPHIVIADYDFGVFPFINETREKRPDIPFIIISELELIQNAPRQGLNIYVLQSDLSRIPHWLDALNGTGTFNYKKAEWNTQIKSFQKATETVRPLKGLASREEMSRSTIAMKPEQTPVDPLKKWTEELENRMSQTETTTRVKSFRQDPLYPFQD